MERSDVGRIPAATLSALAGCLFAAGSAYAVCPICTIAVGAGLGLSRWLGIDDAITGIWIGGLVVSMIAWTESLLDAHNVRVKGRAYLTTLAYLAFTILPLYWTGIIGDPQNAAGPYGLDKLLWGIVAGAAAFWCGASWYFYLKERNGGHAHFPFQKVVMPIAPLLVLTLVFHFLE
jgi:hypothetical protein